MISARDHDELRAVAIAFTRLDRTLKSAINKQNRLVLDPAWKQEVHSKVRFGMDARILEKGTRVKAGNPPVAMAATSTRAIGKDRRLKPSENWYAWEFGANRETVTTYKRRSVNGKTHEVRRHTARQLPPRYKKGRVIYPAFAEFAPRAAALWVQTTVRAIHEAAEGKS